MVCPKLGASAKRTERGITDRKILLGKCLYNSVSTSLERLVRVSYMVMTAPKTSNSGFRFSFTKWMVEQLTGAPPARSTRLARE